MFTKLFFIVSFAFYINAIKSSNLWEKAEIAQNVLNSENYKGLDEFCKENDCNFDNNSPIPREMDKRTHKHISLETIPLDDSKFSFFPSYHQQRQKLCSCHHEKRLADLGPHYFPRYIPDMVCLPGGCGPNYACKPKRFKIWVMHKRQEDDEPGIEPIPKELREFWIGETVMTTIDCECSP